MNEIPESKLRNLEMVQNIITRMSSNCFALKGWAVTLVTATLALSSNHSFIAFIPLIVFWILDAYYLQLERKYRDLFRFIRGNDTLDFVLDLKEAKDVIGESKKTKFWVCLVSNTELLFYLPLAIVVLIVIRIF